MKIRRQRRKTKCAYKFQVYFYFYMLCFFFAAVAEAGNRFVCWYHEIAFIIGIFVYRDFFKNSLRIKWKYFFFSLNITCYVAMCLQSRITNTSVGSPRYLQGTIVKSMQSLCYINYMLLFYLSTSQSPSTLV